MYLSVIDNRYSRVIHESFVKLLSARGYERKDSQFYLKSGRIGKLITVTRGMDHPHHGQVVMFTIHVRIASDDFWKMNYPDETVPVLPSQDYRYYVFELPLGKFYNKLGGDRWLALDGTVPERMMIGYLRDLLQARILPYLDQFDSIEDILAGLPNPSTARMQMLARLGSREEAYAELRKLIAWRHQKGHRINMVRLAKQIGIIH
ncbi:hypothetical protein [Persicitalea jodogahamensis]|uniref:DUF4304 domain-containing protein n=1 Tax=Persicitalea jodogahamensis TaxID=402147 RepID=A0A8J3D5J7_9BACT|nr:hypothetical protein [Persicitalea jodogahamensis]GHB86266.1 hypothetical protein GCM10007390_47190 [Persicitalea jodogahamensis]